jgi:hypothetical protein
MEPTLDILEVIGQQCDLKTKFNLCLASKEYSTRNYGQFRQVELNYMTAQMTHIMSAFIAGQPDMLTFRMYNRFMRRVMTFPHMLRQSTSLRELITTQLVEWESMGLGRRKVVRYRAFLASV